MKHTILRITSAFLLPLFLVGVVFVPGAVASAPALTFHILTKLEAVQGATNVVVLDVTLPGPDTDTFLDGDGTASAGAGTTGTISAGATLTRISLPIGDALCGNTSGVTAPGNIVHVVGGTCASGGTRTVVLGSDSGATNDLSAAGSLVTFYDAVTVNGFWDDGEDIFLDVDNSIRYNSDIFDALTVVNAGTISTTDIMLVKLWADKQNNGFDTGDTLVDNGCAYNAATSNWECDSLGYELTAPRRMQVTVDISPSTPVNANVRMCIPALYDANSNSVFNSGDRGIFFSHFGESGTGNHDFPSSQSLCDTVYVIAAADTTPPVSPYVTINGGAELATSSNVTVSVSATGATWVQISEDNTFTNVAKQAYTSGLMPFQFTLSEGTGIKTVYARFEDDAGNKSSVVSDTINITAYQPYEPPVEETVILVDTAGTTLVDGNLIKTADNPDVYIIKLAGDPSSPSGQVKKFKRLILNPAIFESYGHLKWENIQTVSQAVSDAFTESQLVQEINADGSIADEKVYILTSEANSDTGVKRWLDLTPAAFEAAGYDWDARYFINHTEASPSFYPLGAPITEGS